VPRYRPGLDSLSMSHQQLRPGASPYNPYGWGGNVHGTAGSIGKEICCIHGKERSLAHLEEIIPGALGMRCRAEVECKMGASAAPHGAHAPAPSESYECSVHAKPRSLNFLEWRDGAFQCKTGFECMSTVGAAPCKVLCTLHNRVRALEVMLQEKDGQWVCKPGARCKGTTVEARQLGSPYARPPQSQHGNLVCMLHNKKRASKYLMPHPSIPGAMVCLPDSGCK
jgi:hypothetical protein